MKNAKNIMEKTKQNQKQKQNFRNYAGGAWGPRAGDRHSLGNCVVFVFFFLCFSLRCFFFASEGLTGPRGLAFLVPESLTGPGGPAFV